MALSGDLPHVPARFSDEDIYRWVWDKLHHNRSPRMPITSILGVHIHLLRPPMKQGKREREKKAGYLIIVHGLRRDMKRVTANFAMPSEPWTSLYRDVIDCMDHADDELRRGSGFEENALLQQVTVSTDYPPGENETHKEFVEEFVLTRLGNSIA